VPEELKQERRARLMEKAEAISRAKLKATLGHTLEVLVDQVREDGVAVARSKADAPEIDGLVYVKNGGRLRPGDIVKARIERTEAFDRVATLVGVAPAPLTPKPAPGRRMHRVISRL